ncbi:midkine [Pimephales promelas]|nr:midkine [Pimephales promelas]
MKSEVLFEDRSVCGGSGMVDSSCDDVMTLEAQTTHSGGQTKRKRDTYKGGCWRRFTHETLARPFSVETFNTENKMRGLFSTLIVVLVALMIVTTEAGKNKKEKNKGGVREGTCNEQTKKVKCRVPCNWKKDFGADCKYKFGNWGECDSATSLKSRTGTLQKALFNVDCQQTISVSKPCATKVKNKPKGKKNKGKGN